jgi:hypothetical protein
MSVHASTLRLPVSEVEFDYGRRMEGSQSKLSTFRDGFRILRMMGMLMKETRPFLFFAYLATFLFSASIILMAPVIRDFLETGLVDRIPTWILAMVLLLASMMTLIAGIILDSVARGRAEQKHIYYLSIAPSRGEQYRSGTTQLVERRQSERLGENPAQRGSHPR